MASTLSGLKLCHCNYELLYLAIYLKFRKKYFSDLLIIISQLVLKKA